MIGKDEILILQTYYSYSRTDMFSGKQEDNWQILQLFNKEGDGDKTVE